VGNKRKSIGGSQAQQGEHESELGPYDANSMPGFDTSSCTVTKRGAAERNCRNRIGDEAAETR
jgi:hypothetical protein